MVVLLARENFETSIHSSFIRRDGSLALDVASFDIRLCIDA